MIHSASQWALLEAIPDAAVVIDAEGTVVACNQAWKLLCPTPYIPENYLQLLRDFANDRRIAADDRLTVTAAIGQICDVLEGRRSEASFSIRWPRKEGGSASPLVLDSSVRVYDAMAVVCHRDLSVLHQQIEGIEDAAYRYDRLIAGLPVGIYCKDRHLRYVAANRAFADTVGRDVDELIGVRDEDLFDRLTAQERENEDQRILTTGRPEQREMTLDLHGRRTHVREDKRPLRDADGTILGVVGLLSDISDQKSAEDAAEQARHQAEAGLRAKASFLINVGHEIRTPMNALAGLLHMLEQGDLSSPQRDIVGRLTSASQSLLAILNDVLDVSALEAGRLELEKAPTNLPDAIEELNAALSPLAHEQGLELNVSVSPDIPRWVMADKERLQQVLVNLLGNGIKFTRQGSVSLDVQQIISHNGVAQIRFVVSDTGIGISLEQQSDLFQLFHQADSSRTRRYGGTGLGLALSSRLVAMMGGAISVYSRPDQGATFDFTLRLPLAEEPVGTSALGLLAEDESTAEQDEDVADDFLWLDLEGGLETVPVDEDFASALADAQGPVMDEEATSAEAEDDDEPLVLGEESVAPEAIQERHVPLSFRTAGAVNGRSARPKAAPLTDLAELAARSSAVGDLAPTTPLPAPAASPVELPAFEDEDALPVAAPKARSTEPLPAWMSGLPMASLAGLDVVDALRRLDGDGELLLSLLEQFEETQNGIVTKMTALAEKGDLAEISGLAHALKGSAANLGAANLARAAESVMRLARAGDLEGTLGVLVPLRRQLALTLYAIEALQRHIQAHLPAPAAPPEKQAGTTTEFRADFERLYRLLGDNSMDAGEVYQNIRGPMVSIAGEGLVRDLGRAIQRLEYARALKILMEIAMGLEIPSSRA